MMDDSGVLAALAMMMYQTKTERLWLLTKNGGLWEMDCAVFILLVGAGCLV
jgi:hypothetical protein